MGKKYRFKIICCLLYVPAIILMLIVFVLNFSFDIPIRRFTCDPLAIAQGNPFHGVISNIGVILWSFAASICFFTYLLLKTRNKSHGISEFILFGGVLSLILLLDDLFMLHERIYPKWCGISEEIVLLLYGVATLCYVVKFRRIIIKTDFIFIVLAAVFFAFSLVIDALPKYLFPWQQGFEDVPKFFGIVSWLGYQFSVCFQAIQKN